MLLRLHLLQHGWDIPCSALGRLYGMHPFTARSIIRRMQEAGELPAGLEPPRGARPLTSPERDRLRQHLLAHGLTAPIRDLAGSVPSKVRPFASQ